MVKIMFVCHGNICRSPMAEYVLKDSAVQQGVAAQLEIASCATSTEEIGSDVHPGTKRVLREHTIACPPRRAVQLCRTDAGRWQLFLGMDNANVRNMQRILGVQAVQAENAAALQQGLDAALHGGTPLVCRLGDFAALPREIADPWYTGNFAITFQEVQQSCQALLARLQQMGRLR